jgi:hypothetical protein
MCINCGKQSKEVICQSCIGNVEVAKITAIQDKGILDSIFKKLKNLKDKNSNFLLGVVEAKLYPNSIIVGC